MTQVVKLQVAIEAHGESLDELTLRRPTVQEVRSIKALPYRIDKSEEVSLDMDVAAKYIAVCAGIPPSSVNQLDLADLNGLSWAVASFFHECGVAAIGDLIAAAYDLAWFWKVDPEQMMARPLDVLRESLEHAQRINAMQQVQ